MGGGMLSACDDPLLRLLNDGRPNFLIILTDDQRFDTMQYMPRTKELIFDQGVTFNHGYITTPLCGPSRCSILTGMYAHTHGVVDNDDEEFAETTFIEHLKASGYFTGLVGKYLNTWKGDPRPEFDYWVAFSRGESRYNNPRLNVNGEWIRHQGQYITDAMGGYMLEFLEKAAQSSRPFCLYFAPNAPHEPATPAYEDKFLELELPKKPPSFNEKDVTDKPKWLEKDPLLTETEIGELDDFIRNQILTLYALDRAIAATIEKLEKYNMLDRTVVLFLSDNGKLWGEHRRETKNSFYEEATRVPFAMRYPPLVPKPYVEDRVVANIDIAPTLYELAKIFQPEGLDGVSITGLFEPGGAWRAGVLIEGWPGRGVYSAYHTGRYVYGETIGDRAEFYDLEKDPYQLENDIDNPEYQEIILQLKTRLAALRENP